MLTGGDPIRAEDKNVKSWTYHNVAKLTFSCNKVPRVPEDSTAFFRRWIIVEFPFSFEGTTQEDRELKEKLTGDPDEMSGFLNWALEGLLRLRSNGWRFSNGKTVDIVRDDYIVRSDPYKAFIMHCITADSKGQVKKDELFSAYKEHCDIHKVTSRSRDAFFKNFKDNFKPGVLTDYRPNKEEDPDRSRMFKGIALRPRELWCQKEDDEKIPEQHEGRQGGLSGLGGPEFENPSRESKESSVFTSMSAEDKGTQISPDPVTSAVQNEKNDASAATGHDTAGFSATHENHANDTHAEKPYADIGTVLTAFKDRSLEVMEYDPIFSEPPETWKAKIKGSFESYSEQ